MRRKMVRSLKVLIKHRSQEEPDYESLIFTDHSSQERISAAVFQFFFSYESIHEYVEAKECIFINISCGVSIQFFFFNFCLYSLVIRFNIHFLMHVRKSTLKFLPAAKHMALSDASISVCPIGRVRKC